MNKLFSKGTLIIFGSLSFLILIAWVFRITCFDIPVRATIYPLNVEVGSPIHFSDSTKNAHMVTWEFGNGDVENKRCGEYTFKEVGQYQVRLTIDNNKTAYFLVDVKDSKKEKEQNLVKIVAPKTAFQNERVVFMADGDADNWRWEFGESGKLDSQEKNPIYFYSKVGTYEVKLISSNMKYSAVHTIQILPELTFDVRDPGHQKLDKVREYLQKIVDRKGSFNGNYDMIKKLLHANDHLVVLVNGTKENALSDYCSGLKIMGKQQSTMIQEVAEEYAPNGKIKRLMVTQSSLE